MQLSCKAALWEKVFIPWLKDNFTLHISKKTGDSLETGHPRPDYLTTLYCCSLSQLAPWEGYFGHLSRAAQRTVHGPNPCCWPCTCRSRNRSDFPLLQESKVGLSSWREYWLPKRQYLLRHASERGGNCSPNAPSTRDCSSTCSLPLSGLRRTGDDFRFGLYSTHTVCVCDLGVKVHSFREKWIFFQFHF